MTALTDTVVRHRASLGLPRDVVVKLRGFISTLPDCLDLSSQAAEDLVIDPLGPIPIPTGSDLRDPENRLLEVHQDPWGDLTRIIIRRGYRDPGIAYTYVVEAGGVLAAAWTSRKRAGP